MFHKKKPTNVHGITASTTNGSAILLPVMRSGCYVNRTRKRQWLGAGQIRVATPKNDLHPKKIMLSVWWKVRGIIHWELLSTGCAITADLYCQQLDRVASKLQEKQDRIYFLHDNTRPHIAKSTREKLLKLG
jgi:histone-lysine N-methyltransferase SETMAR